MPDILVHTRSIADPGFYYPLETCSDPVRGYRVYETAIAVNGIYEMEVSVGTIPAIADGAFVPCTDEFRGRVRYAFRSVESSSWTADYLRPLEFTSTFQVEDPCIAPGPGETEFMIVAKTAGQIVFSKFDAATGQSTAWAAIHPLPEEPAPPVDKPWIVRAGSSTYHVAFMVGFGSTDAHMVTTQNGGTSWSGGAVTIGATTLGTQFCPQPAIHVGTQTLFVGFRANADVGVARRTGSATSTVFEILQRPSGSNYLSRIELFNSGVGAQSCLPAPHPDGSGSCTVPDTLHSVTMPYLAVDPSTESATRLYLANNDQGHSGGVSGENSDPSDMDVVIRRIERVSTSPERWDVISTVRVPHCVLPEGCTGCTYVGSDLCAHPDATQSTPPAYPDQFCPAIAVDRFGRVHLVFYSNALTCGINSLGQVYDVYYALSTDQAQTFAIRSLRSCSQRPALDFDFAPSELQGDYSPREYIGIAVDDSDSEHTYVSLSYSGTAHGANTTNDRSAIYAQTVRVANP